ncbi:hypothetical protein PY254_16470 [Rhodanobacter sp. AS-Z3]|uniref:hypothetical protein n=1 Tax=Rhodanobacter sp. AS-Z3 TaxID=3031330 RepID=UPI00247B1D0E|nr:hypothetical protein [Rhodanobacter sp. AS-Z3]WEN14805.1 hypothetical protein PY254_16470 [Rhodanobacter sp. AS-Z3]
MSEAKPEDVPNHGLGCQAYQEKSLRRFPAKLPPRPQCGAAHENHFINNVRWCRVADGTELPEGTSPEQLIAQGANFMLVWICVH